MEILKTCIPLTERKTNAFECNASEWEISGKVGESSVYGDVYIACCKQNCQRVIKIQKASSKKVAEETSLESDIQVLASENGLAPKFFIQIFVMEILLLLWKLFKKLLGKL